VEGAVYKPELETVPTVELPPAAPFTLQVTLRLDAPVTVAVNCTVPPVWTVAVAGEIEICTAGGPLACTAMADVVELPPLESTSAAALALATFAGTRTST
jgi:hypothetical protein